MRIISEVNNNPNNFLFLIHTWDDNLGNRSPSSKAFETLEEAEKFLSTSFLEVPPWDWNDTNYVNPNNKNRYFRHKENKNEVAVLANVLGNMER